LARTRRIGAHVSIAGSLLRAIAEAEELAVNTIQIFSRSPRMWKAPPLDPEQVEAFRKAREEHGIGPLAVHASYLLNMASPDAVNRKRSIASFRDELERARMLGADGLVLHPGSAKGYDAPDPAIATLAESIAEATEDFDWDGLELLLENTAGGGSSLGRSFEELAAIRETILSKTDIPVGYCIDTAHTLAAGYEITTREGLRETVKAVDRTLSLDRVKVVHANDSKSPLGSRLDRHEHIGEGKIGREAFARIVNHPKLRSKPFILETPHGEDGTHQRNVEALRSLIR